MSETTEPHDARLHEGQGRRSSTACTASRARCAGSSAWSRRTATASTSSRRSPRSPRRSSRSRSRSSTSTCGTASPARSPRVTRPIRRRRRGAARGRSALRAHALSEAPAASRARLTAWRRGLWVVSFAAAGSSCCRPRRSSFTSFATARLRLGRRHRARGAGPPVPDLARALARAAARARRGPLLLRVARALVSGRDDRPRRSFAELWPLASASLVAIYVVAGAPRGLVRGRSPRRLRRAVRPRRLVGARRRGRRGRGRRGAAPGRVLDRVGRAAACSSRRSSSACASAVRRLRPSRSCRARLWRPRPAARRPLPSCSGKDPQRGPFDHSLARKERAPSARTVRHRRRLDRARAARAGGGARPRADDRARLPPAARPGGRVAAGRARARARRRPGARAVASTAGAGSSSAGSCTSRCCGSDRTACG